MARRRELLKVRKGKLTRRQQRGRWMARIILLGLTVMLAISITLTLWPPLPDSRETEESPAPVGAMHPTATPGLEFPSGSPPPGLKLEPEAPGSPEPGDSTIFGQDMAPPSEFFDQQHLDIHREFGWQAPGPSGEEEMEGPPEE